MGALTPHTFKNPKRASKVVVNDASIQKLRKDWLTLARNVKRVRSIADINTLVQGVHRWAQHIDELWMQIQDDLKERERGWKQDHPYGPDISIPYYIQDRKPLWMFRSKARAIPEGRGFSLIDIDKHKKNLIRNRLMTPEEADAYLARETPSPEEQERVFVEHWREEARLWAQRARKKAVEAWKWLGKYVEWTTDDSLSGGGGGAPLWNMRDVVNYTLGGFKTRLIGLDENDSFHMKELGDLEAGLREYRKRAQQRFPLLLKKQLPFDVFFSGGPGSRSEDAAATYNRDHIEIGVWAMMGKPREVVKILAHEMSHHLFQTVLSSGARDFWTHSIKGDLGELDLRVVLKMRRPNENLHELDRRIERSDPVLHLKLESLLYDRRYKDLDLLGLSRIEGALDADHLDPIVNVPKNPITGYASKNPEEAFCEAVGLLVAYGHHAILPKVKTLLRIVAPGIKVSSQSVLRLAEKYIRAASLGVSRRRMAQ